MLQEPIRIDLDGEANRRRIAAIEQQLDDDCDGRLPFLLLPVRIETRFMRVDRPLADSGNDLAERLAELQRQLSEIATRPLTTRLEEATRKIVKATEKSHYEFLDTRLARIGELRSGLIHCLRNCPGTTLQDADELARAGRQLRQQVNAAQANLAQMRSSFQQGKYRDRLNHIDRQLLTPIDQQLAAAVRKLQLTARLRFIEVADVRHRIAAIQRDVERINRNRLRDYSALKRARETLYPALHELRSAVHAIIRGDGDALRAMRSEWQQLDQALAALQQTVARVPVTSRYQAAGRSRTLTHIEKEYRRDLEALGGGSQRRFQILSNKAFIASAEAVFGVDQLLEQQLTLLQAPPAAASRSATQLLSIARGVLQLAERIAALCRDIAIIPSDRYSALTRQQQQLEQAWDTVSGELDQLAGSGGRDAATAARLRSRLRPSLAAQERAIFGQRSDVWDVYDRFYDEFRRKIFAVDTAHQETVDELWLRIYPDDIAIHTHEQGLTDDELRDGRDFWIETHAAEQDEELKRGAWRALVRLHGSRRSAWLARQLQPTVTRPFAAAQQLLNTLQILQRRISEVGSKRGRLLRQPLQRIRRIQAAAEAALESLQLTRQITRRQQQRVQDQLRLIVAGMGEISGHFDRRSRFLSDRRETGQALQQLAAALQQLQLGIKALPVVELRDQVRASLQFPDVEQRAAAWSVAPHCKVLPDRFIALAVQHGRLVHAVAGNRIGELKVGLDPDPDADDASQFQLDDEGRLQVGESIRWMTDFDQAVANGMGITIRIDDEEAEQGFDELFVLGVRGLSAAASAQLLEQLLEGHHYSEEGLGLLPLGTPTNNTGEQPAAWRSDDDPDASYPIEREGPLFDPAESDPAAQCDGQRLAEALGIRSQLFSHVEHADKREMAEAGIINHALWPATIGAYAEEFLGPLISTATLQRLESFFVEHVTARGKLPALRIGSQPYGMVVTSAFSQFQSALGDELPALPPGGIKNLSADDHALRFDILLQQLLRSVAEDWSRIRATKVAHAHSEVIDDAQQHFMQMLGLHATSVSADYRFALNVGGRHPARAADANLRLDHTAVGPDALLQHFQAFYRRALYLGNSPVYNADGSVSEPFSVLHRAVFDGRLYDVRYLQRPHSLRGPLIGSNPAAAITRLLNRPVAALLSEGRGQDERRQALLILLLRQALMMRMRFAALNILEREQMLDAELRQRAGSADEFMVRSLLSRYTTTKWNFLFGDLQQLNSRLDIDFPAGPHRLFSYLTNDGSSHSMADYLANRGDNLLYQRFPMRANHHHEVVALQAHAAAVEQLKQIPTSHLELLLREHIDLCSHRLDAWQLGLANRRLAENRSAPTTPAGLYLGAYGWVENLRPGGQRELAGEVPPTLHIDGEEPIYTDPDNQGFIHCPSINQAVTAAVLRSGYLTEADATDIDNRMAVNLSSRRVRLALGLLDGVQSGQELGTLLGYRFERQLHQAYQRYGISFDALIYDFRRAFPGAGAVDPESLSTARGSRLVTDGLTLLDTVNDWIEQHVDLDARSDRTLFQILRDGGSYSGRPWGLPVIDAARRDGVLQAIDGLADALDALGDLALAEGVFQIVRGNFPRAAAVLAALAEGRAMPTPEVVETPRTGITLTQRIVLPLHAIDGRALSAALTPDSATLESNRRAALPDAWNHLPMTPRANAEPALNRWLGDLLGPPGMILCICGDPVTSPQVVTAEQLGLQPIDWLMLLGSGLEEAEAELAARLQEPLLPADGDLAAAIDNGFAAPRVNFAERDPLWPTAARTLYEIAPLLAEVATLLGRARPLHADDLQIDEQSVEAGAAEHPGWDLQEADARIDETRRRLHTLTLALMQLHNGDSAPGEAPGTIDPHAWVEAHRGLIPDPGVLLTRRAELAGLLLQAAQFGIRLALPPLDFSSREAVANTLAAALSNALIQCVKRLQRASSIASSGIQGHFDRIRSLLGKGFVMIPAFTPQQPLSLRDQLLSNQLLRDAGPFAMDGFLAAAASVRDSLAHLQRIWALGEAFGATIPQPRPAQLPVEADDYWLAIDFPPGHRPQSDKLSLLVLDPEAWTLGTGPVCALLIDQWHELIPVDEESTGVSLFYDQPDATPPQALLLAVSPRAAGNWRWSDLLHTLHDTLEIARNRTVEPEHLDDTLYAQLLPAILGEVVPNLIDDETEELTGSRAILDFGSNN